ncbi:unnamed protein product [Gongylonema pulchrum]|uniref:LRRCT domain-containing protein n=1 Tax=Gongylonema pulchrum TaxID=637853 RepID=A0A183CW79_9BILA|nr:unnamed protein product [Gongylonema pulchrum]
MDITDFNVLLIYLSCYHVQVAVNTRRGDLQCPSRCSCAADVAEQDFLVISCKWSSLSVSAAEQQHPFAHFPVNITKTLNIDCDSTATETADHYDQFSENLFTGFSNLQNLRIQRCKTHALPRNLLHGLSNLRSVHFYQLERLKLPDDFFTDNKRLEKLTIVECNLEALPDSLLCDSPYIQPETSIT